MATAHPFITRAGRSVPMSEVVDAIDAAAPEMKGKITFEQGALGIPPGIDDSALVERIGPNELDADCAGCQGND